MPRRTVFFVSDSSGITAEVLGHSLMPHFPGIEFNRVTMPFINTVARAQQAVARIVQTAQEDGLRPIVLSTLIDPSIRGAMRHSAFLVLDFFEIFLGPLEEELEMVSVPTMGRMHNPGEYNSYMQRIEAVNYALGHDDGSTLKGLNNADVILMGVSRCGKTPTSLYLAMQYGINAANYPIVPEDMGEPRLPQVLAPYRAKLFGLTIDPERLTQIRQERRPDSRYASLDNCRFEVGAVEDLMRRENVSFLNTTHKSVEEIASHIVHAAGLTRRAY